MKVLLCPPLHHYWMNQYPSFLSVSDWPQGFAYIAGALKKAGHQVIGLNLNNVTGYESQKALLTDRLRKALSPDIGLIGLGGIAVDYSFVKDAIHVCRETRIPIVLGGNMITQDGEFLFNLLKPDFAIEGEAEENIVRLANALEKGTSVKEVDNLHYWNSQGAAFTKKNHNYGNLDDRAFPDYEPFNIKDMVDNYSDATRLLYRYSRPDARPFIISASRSCPFTCSFCIHGRREIPYRARSIPNIMAELKEMWERYHFNVLIILDELFAVNRKRMIEFCEGVLDGRTKYGWDFDWMFQTHASARLDKDTLSLAKRAGCFFFSYGLESASPTVIKSMGKKTTPEQIIEAMRLAEETDIGFGGNLIFGDPAETPKTICESVAFFAKYCDKAMVFTGVIAPYPGSKLFEGLVSSGRIKDKRGYYETIDKGIWNLTKVPQEVLKPWLDFTRYLDSSWEWVKRTKAKSIVELAESTPMSVYQKTKFHLITADCPYCGAEVHYKHAFAPSGRLPENSFTGCGCQKCNRKIRIDMDGMEVSQ